MKELYYEFFHIPKHGKILEKVMLVRVALIIVIMVVCLAAMSITAYAYFSYSITSGSNLIQAANFEAKVTIEENGSNTPITLSKDGKIQTAMLEAGEYTINLTKGESTAKTGFCLITIGDTAYYTQQIGVDVKKNSSNGEVLFTLKVSSKTRVKILSHWGTSSCYGSDKINNPGYIQNGTEINLTDSTGEKGESSSTEKQVSTKSNSSENSANDPTMESGTSSNQTTQPEMTQMPESSSTTSATMQSSEITGTESTEEMQSVAEKTESPDTSTTKTNDK